VVERIKLSRWGAVLVVAVVATAIAVGPGLAGSTGSATRPIEKGNDDCGSTQGKKVVGKVTYKRSGDILNVIWTVHGADPGDYSLSLYDPVGCGYTEFAPTIGHFKVSAGGNGNDYGSANVAGFGDSFFACEQNQSTLAYDCGLVAKP
jgi:hypothetical protein